jgi:hypothetical protein
MVVNMDSAKGSQDSLAGLGMKRASLLRLSAPAADSTEGVTFGGVKVDENGRWKAGRPERLHDGSFVVPSMSAAVVLARHV